MTKRRLTHTTVAHTTHSGAPLLMSGNDAICPVPEKTTSDITTAHAVPRLLLAIATPATTPQAEMPSAMPVISRAPRRNSAWRHRAGATAETSLMTPIVYGAFHRARRVGSARHR